MARPAGLYEVAMKIETRVAYVANQRRRASQALVIRAGHDLMPSDSDAVAAHARAGEGMKTVCSTLGKLDLGAAVSTPPFNLSAKAVFHVHAPRDVPDSDAADQLQRAVRAILNLAGEHDVQSLVMPALSTGRDRARNDVAAAIIVKTLRDYAPLLAPKLLQVTLCVPSWALVFGFAKAQQLNDSRDHRPKTVDSAVHHLMDTLPARTLADLSAMADHDLIQTHMGLALYLRNGILRGNFALHDDAGGRHPDETSSIVVKALWRELKRNETNAPHLSGQL